MSLVTDLGLFVRALSSRWWLWIFTLAGAVSFLVDFFLPTVAIPTWLGWAILAIGFFLATFDAWREQKHHIVELEGADADIRFEPMKGPALIEFRLPESYQLVPSLVPPKIWLLLNFLLINRGGEVGSLDRVFVARQELGTGTEITFSHAGMFPHLSQRQWERFQIHVPVTLVPNEHKKITYLLSTTITEHDPERFAEQLGRLTTFRVALGWAFSGKQVDLQSEVEVKGRFDRLKKGVFEHWRQQGREDLIEVASKAVGS